ncbi:MAG TPA: nitronate monooxygenase [Thermoanaerobaculia bacterium]|nr:nitronate monooxygenase [Thermoanaerobaculia bacterium]
MALETRLTKRLGIRLPIFQAPMGGGPSTPALAAAVSNAGGFGSLAGGYLTPAAIEAEIRATRELTGAPFGVNLFALAEPPVPSNDAIDAANRALDVYRDELQIARGTRPAKFSERFEEQAAVILAEKPAVFSFTFGIPPRAWLDRFRAAGIVTMGTATNVAEARALRDAGVDVVCAQGAEAGGHRGTFLGTREEGMLGLFALIPLIRAAVDLPIVAAGGIMNGGSIAAALALGADAAQLGTAFLLTPEAGTSAPYRLALQERERTTAITRSFSGRDARGIDNRFMHDVTATLEYPYQNALTRDIRAAAAKAGRSEFLSLWAGQAFALATETPAAELVARLAAETERAIARLAR